MEARSNDYWEMLISRSAQRFFLLFALHERPMHGYELGPHHPRGLRRLLRSHRRHDLPDPTRTRRRRLRRLPDEVVAGRRRKVCRLTDKGEEAYRAAATAWQHMLGPLNRAVDAALKPSGKKAGCCEKAAAKGVPK